MNLHLTLSLKLKWKVSRRERMNKMKSAVFYGKHQLKVEEVNLPVVGEHEVLVEVKACGVCGTDVHIYEGDE